MRVATALRRLQGPVHQRQARHGVVPGAGPEPGPAGGHPGRVGQVPQLQADRDALPQQGVGGVRILVTEDDGGGVERRPRLRVRPRRRGRARARASQARLSPTRPWRTQNHIKAPARRIAGSPRPARKHQSRGRAQIGLLALQHGHPVRLLCPVQPGGGTLRQAQEVVRVGCAQPFNLSLAGLPFARQTLQGELADRLQHGEPGPPPGCLLYGLREPGVGLHQGFGHQGP